MQAKKEYIQVTIYRYIRVSTCFQSKLCYNCIYQLLALQSQIQQAERLVTKEFAMQYKLVKVLIDGSFKVLQEARDNLTNVDLDKLPSIPINNKHVFESLITVWENVGLFGVSLVNYFLVITPIHNDW